MISHRQVMINAATALLDDAAITSYAVTNFGSGLEIVIGAYPGTEDDSGIPSVANAPFLWLYAAGENEEISADQGFTMHAVLGACVTGTSGEKVISNEVRARSTSQNGLIVNGGNKAVEDLRDLIITKLSACAPGAILAKVRRTENDLSHYPLEWAEFECDFLTFDTLNNGG